MRSTCEHQRPMNAFSLKGHTPIFRTAKEELSFVRAGVMDERETGLMRVRLGEFFFSN